MLKPPPLVTTRLCFAVLIGAVMLGCHGSRQSTVIVYVSEDQVFSEPILRDFERDIRPVHVSLRVVLLGEQPVQTRRSP